MNYKLYSCFYLHHGNYIVKKNVTERIKSSRSKQHQL